MTCITTVIWSEESDQVELTGADDQIAWDVVMINLTYTPIMNEKCQNLSFQCQ
jgi:hypothetical protein